MIGKRNALYPVGCLVILNFVWALVHRLQSPIDYECNDCGHRFSRRNLTEKIALVVLILFLTVTISELVLQLLALLQQ